MASVLQGKKALITGSSRGIGKAVALRLAGMGCDILLNFVRQEEAAQAAASEIERLGVRCVPFRANAGDPKDIQALIRHAAEKLGGVDILVHNAAIGAFKPVHKLKSNQWDLSFGINTKALLLLVQQALPVMEQRGGGNIIALSSLGAHRYIPNYGAIGVSKAALESLVRYLAVELAPKGIRVNAVSGGLVDTDAIKFFPDHESFREEVIKRTPAGRIGVPDDLAKVVAFLAGPDSGWITGQTLVADGGLSLI